MSNNDAHNDLPEPDDPDQEAEECQDSAEAESPEEEDTHFQDLVSKRRPTSNDRPLSERHPHSGEVFLVRGKDRGNPAWHYVLIDRAKLPLFHKAVESGSLDVADFGKVVKSGWGENPPDEVILEMKEKYG